MGVTHSVAQDPCPECGGARDWRGLCPRCVVVRLLSPAEAALDPAPSRWLGAYELLEEVGRGGMGRVWRARQTGLDRVVAVKTLRAGVAAGESARARFRREALALARVNHPGIVAVHEVGEEDGEPYLVMEFIRGETLAQRLARGPLVAREAAALVATLADAMAAAHAAGVIHRDLKPSNVLLDAARDGAPRLTDFGVALLAGEDGALTATLEGIGTLAYLAPEQLSGQAGQVGPATDVHGLGAVLYHCLTGHPPFAGRTPAEVLRQVAELDPAPVRRWQPTVPADLEVICQRCLRKDPTTRFPDVAALRDDLNRYMRGVPVQSRPITRLERFARWSRRPPVRVALAGVGCLLLAASVALWGLVRHRSIEAVGRQRLGALITNWPAHEPFVAGTVPVGTAGVSALEFSPCGRWLAAGGIVGRVAIRRLDGVGRGRVGEHRASIRDLAWSADGAWLLSGDINGRWKLWNPTNRPGYAAQGQRAVRIDSLAFRPDGQRFFVGYADGVGELWAWDGVQGRAVTNLLHPGSPSSAVFGRDGRWLLTVTDTGQIAAWDAATGVLQRRFAAAGRPVASLSPDGTVVAFVATNAPNYDFIQFARVDHGQDLARPLRVVNGAQQLVWSPDGGRLGVISGIEARLYPLWERRDLRLEIRHDSRVSGLVFSPDGLRVLTITAEGRARLWDAHTGAPLTSSFPHPQHEWLTGFSPDGRLLATSHPDGHVRLWDLRPGLPVGWADEADLIRALAGFDSLAALRLRAWFEPNQPEVLRQLASGTRRVGTPEASHEASLLERRAAQPPGRQQPPRAARGD